MHVVIWVGIHELPDRMSNTCFVEADGEEVKVSFPWEVAGVHAQCYGGGGSSLLVAASIARQEQGRHTLQWQR